MHKRIVRKGKATKKVRVKKQKQNMKGGFQYNPTTKRPTLSSESASSISSSSKSRKTHKNTSTFISKNKLKTYKK